MMDLELSQYDFVVKFDYQRTYVWWFLKRGISGNKERRKTKSRRRNVKQDNKADYKKRTRTVQTYFVSWQNSCSNTM